MSDDLDAQRPVIVTMPKEIDASNASAVGDTLDAAFTQGAMVVVVDCTRTKFCDSVGFNILLLTNQKARAANAKLLFVIAPNGLLRRVLELLEMQDALAVYPSLDAAVTASRQLLHPDSGNRAVRDGARSLIAGGRPDTGRPPWHAGSSATGQSLHQPCHLPGEGQR